MYYNCNIHLQQLSVIHLSGEYLHHYVYNMSYGIRTTHWVHSHNLCILPRMYTFPVSVNLYAVYANKNKNDDYTPGRYATVVYTGLQY